MVKFKILSLDHKVELTGKIGLSNELSKMVFKKPDISETATMKNLNTLKKLDVIERLGPKNGVIGEY